MNKSSDRGTFFNFFLIVFFAVILFVAAQKTRFGFSGSVVSSPLVTISPVPLATYPFITYLPVPQTLKSPVPAPVENPSIQAQSAVLYSLTDEKIIFSHNLEQRLNVASITKLMTAYVARQKEVPGQRLFTITAEDLAVEYANPALAVGDQFTFEESLRFLLIASDNAIAHMLARETLGSTAQFVAEMNATARSLGMTNTVFVDPIGLGDNLSTAYDLTRLAQKILQDYPSLFSISRYNQLTLISGSGKTFVLKNTNILVDKIPGFIGGKTGYTPTAGGSLLVIFKIKDQTLISIVLGSPDRFGDTSRLVQWYIKNQ